MKWITREKFKHVAIEFHEACNNQPNKILMKEEDFYDVN